MTKSGDPLAHILDPQKIFSRSYSWHLTNNKTKCNNSSKKELELTCLWYFYLVVWAEHFAISLSLSHQHHVHCAAHEMVGGILLLPWDSLQKDSWCVSSKEKAGIKPRRWAATRKETKDTRTAQSFQIYGLQDKPKIKINEINIQETGTPLGVKH